MIRAEDVLEVLDRLDRAGIEVWLDGGWGVDALLGEQTRPHNDLDLALGSADRDRFLLVMAAAGFEPVREDGPFNLVLADRDGREVDAHFVDLGTTRLDEGGVAVYGPAGLAYRVGGLRGRGTVLGRPVACCTVEHQVWSHTGYQVDEDDVRDVLALHRRFGVQLPPPYADAAPPGPPLDPEESR